MNTANIQIVVGLILTALKGVSDLTAVLETAAAEGRDVTGAELATLRAKAQASVDALSAASGS